MTTATLSPADFFPLAEAARYFPRSGGRKVSLKTLYRWAASGLRKGKLRTIKLGHQVCTCEEWVRAFIADLNGAPADHLDEAALSNSEAARRESVGRALDGIGI